jgi:hypothetical protein
MYRILTIIFFLSPFAAFAQASSTVDPKITSEQAPPQTDAALRDRIKQFYQAHVDGKFRLANKVVAEDSQDFFFAIQKPRYLSFEIIRINYSPDFTHADAVVACRSEFVVEGHKFDSKIPVTSHWKLIDGEWFWYMEPTTEIKTPFGVMRAGPNKDGSEPPTVIPDARAAAQAILSAVQADTTDVRLSGYESSSAEVHIKNGMLGPVQLSVDIDGGFPGLSATLDKTQVKAGDTATLKFVCEPKDRSAKPTLTARVTVQPTNQVLAIKLTFAVPPEVEKLIPKSPQAAGRGLH